MYQLKGYNGISIGTGQPLLVMAGLNVLEDEGLALEVAAELKQICNDLSLPYVFKASFDKANRSSISSYRGPDRLMGWQCCPPSRRYTGYPLSLTSTRPSRLTRLQRLPRLFNCLPFCAPNRSGRRGAKAVARNGGWLHARKRSFSRRGIART